MPLRQRILGEPRFGHALCGVRVPGALLAVCVDSMLFQPTGGSLGGLISKRVFMGRPLCLNLNLFHSGAVLLNYIAM